MASMKPQQYIKLARSLPPQLTRFFARYPTPTLVSSSNQSPNQPTSPSTAPSSSPTDLTTDALSAASNITVGDEIIPNPFRAQKHPITRKWHDPVFSLRRQADLVKMAREHGVEELLPFSVKNTAERIRKRAENGLRVKGTGIGQRVKGKASERQLKGRLEKRRQAMLEMPQMIQTWKARGHGRGWKKWPK